MSDWIVVDASRPTEPVLAAYRRRDEAEAEREHLIRSHGYETNELEVREVEGG